MQRNDLNYGADDETCYDFARGNMRLKHLLLTRLSIHSGLGHALRKSFLSLKFVFLFKLSTNSISA